MIKTTVKIEGMMCGHCENHMDEAVKKTFDVKKVTSSHEKRETVIISEKELAEEKVKEVVDAAGYTFCGMTSEPYKKGILSFLK